MMSRHTTSPTDRAVLATRHGMEAEQDLSAVDGALARIRAVRIGVIARGAPAATHLADQLGPVPESRAARDVWCGLALHIEARLDRGLPGPNTAIGHRRSIEDRLGSYRSIDPLDYARGVISAACNLDDPPGTTDGPD